MGISSRTRTQCIVRLFPSPAAGRPVRASHLPVIRNMYRSASIDQGQCISKAVLIVYDPVHDHDTRARIHQFIIPDARSKQPGRCWYVREGSGCVRACSDIDRLAAKRTRVGRRAAKHAQCTLAWLWLVRRQWPCFSLCG